MENITQLFAMLMTIIGLLVALTNIVVEVLKNIFNKLPTNIIVLIVAVMLTVVAFFVWLDYTATAFVWYYVVAALIVGIMVAYAAMFGFDKLKEILNSTKDNTGGQT